MQVELIDGRQDVDDHLEEEDNEVEEVEGDAVGGQLVAVHVQEGDELLERVANGRVVGDDEVAASDTVAAVVATVAAVAAVVVVVTLRLA